MEDISSKTSKTKARVGPRLIQVGKQSQLFIPIFSKLCGDMSIDNFKIL